MAFISNNMIVINIAIMIKLRINGSLSFDLRYIRVCSVCYKISKHFMNALILIARKSKIISALTILHVILEKKSEF